MNVQIKRHPLYEEFLAADKAWSNEIRAEAQKRHVFPGDFRYTPEAKRLPSYQRFRQTRDRWIEAGKPIAAEEP